MLANHIQHRAAYPGGVRPHAAWDGFAAAAQRAWETLRTWRRRIDERNRLSVLDERMLKDIGLTRTEAIYLSEKPFWRE